MGLAKDSPKLKQGVFLVDLDTGNYVDVQGEEARPAASMIKVPILVSFFQAVDEGRLRLDEVLTMAEKHIAKGSGELQDKPVGSKFTALETANLMITNSDNTATNMLIDRLGGIESLNQQFASWQLKQTQMQNILPDLEGTNKTSAKDLVNLMAEINQGKLISLKSRDLMLRIMEQTRNRSLLPSGLGKGAFIAHKTGNIDSVSGDIGLIDMPNGKRYLVGVLVQREANDPQAQELIRQISSTIYQYFDTSTDPESNSDQVQDDQQ
jgi:beta-lactamase class A